MRARVTIKILLFFIQLFTPYVAERRIDKALLRNRIFITMRIVTFFLMMGFFLFQNNSTINSTSKLLTSSSQQQLHNKFLLRSGLEGLQGLLKSVNFSSPSSSSGSGIDVDAIYTKWSPWSPCRKRCRQVRKRFCTVPAICGKNVLKVRYLKL